MAVNEGAEKLTHWLLNHLPGLDTWWTVARCMLRTSLLILAGIGGNRLKQGLADD